MFEDYSPSGNHVQTPECRAGSSGAYIDEQWLPGDHDLQPCCEAKSLGWPAMSTPTATSSAGKGPEVELHSDDNFACTPACHTHLCAEINPTPLLPRVGTPAEYGKRELGVKDGDVPPSTSAFDDGSSCSEFVLPNLVPEGIEGDREVEGALTADDWFETTYALLSQAR